MRIEGDVLDTDVAIQVSDCGEGIPSDDLSRVFTKFFRRAVGMALNQARSRVDAELAQRREQLAAGERRTRLEAERLDLTEHTRGGRRYGHKHLITQAIERLEDVFVGLGFQVAEGPEVEDD